MNRKNMMGGASNRHSDALHIESALRPDVSLVGQEAFVLGDCHV
jgi:hypothetical protein